MALRRGKPITFRPTTLCDCVDGSNAPPGAMQQLIDLIPDPSTDKMWVPRPASLQNTGFVAGVSLNGFISALLVVGDTAYGMIAATGGFAGKDIPFAYNLATSTVMTVQGPLSANLPTSPATSGPWTPPIMFQVGSRIIVTHPGFPGGATKFGWMDISGLSVNVTGNTTNTSAVITGNPAILGLQPGLLLTGTGIPAATSIVSVANFVLTEAAATHSNTTLDGLASTTGLAVGQVIAANPVLGIPAGTTIASVGAGSVTMSQAATATASGTVTFTGATITMSRNATSSNSQETIAVAGGTTTTPLWGAGDTNINNLPSVPVGGAQFNGRCYFALGTNGIVFSDSLLPCQVSNNPAVQVLSTNDGLAVTAIGPLMEYSSTTGGIVQALIAFEDSQKMQQISGDPTTSNLSMNALPVATGTSAPLSIVPTEYGLAFLSPEGLRIINFQGVVSAPIGDHGSGVTVPFIYSAVPSRMVAAAKSDVIRMSVNNGNLGGQPLQEYWFDLTRKIWSGPHSFPVSLIQPWRNTFLVSPLGTPGLWQSDANPSLTSTYVENGIPLIGTFQTSLQPDNAELAMNALVDTTIAMALGGSAAIVSALDENGSVIQGEGGMLSANVTVAAVNPATLWGQFNWGQASWGGTASPLQQRSVDWTFPVVFKQMSIQVRVSSSFAVKIGNLYMRYQILGYRLQEPLVA